MPFSSAVRMTLRVWTEIGTPWMVSIGISFECGTPAAG
jgi:hypothetical protein